MSGQAQGGGLMKSFSTTITRIAIDKKLEALELYGRFFEYKAMTDYWVKRISGLKFPCPAVFVCGGDTYRFEATGYRELPFKTLFGYVREILEENHSRETLKRGVFAITCVRPQQKTLSEVSG